MFYDDWIIRKEKDESYLFVNGEWLKIRGFKKPHIKRIKHGKRTKFYANINTRKFRRELLNEDSSILRGNNYKKAYGIAMEVD